MEFKIKNHRTSVKDVDESKNRVLIVVSAFGNKDSDGDIIEYGAYKKTIEERGPGSAQPRIKHLVNHDRNALVGRPVEMVEKGEGLEVLSVIAKTSLGKDVMENYKLDLYEHSVSIQIPEDKMGFDEGRDANIIREVKLWEYSSVTWGANAQTPLVGIKALAQAADPMAEINERMAKLQRAVRKGDFTDEAAYWLEYELAYLQKAYSEIITLIGAQPPAEGTDENKEAEAFGAALNEFLTKFEN